MYALEARVGSAHSPRAASARAFALALAWLVASACGGGPPPSPLPDVHSTQPSERLPIDGMWAAEPGGTHIQLERGRAYLQSGFGPDERHGALLFAEVHQTAATRYRCLEPASDSGALVWLACTLELAPDGSLRISSPGPGRPSAPVRPEPGTGSAVPPPRAADATRLVPVALADETWFRAQAESFHIVSLREAHGPPPSVPLVDDSAAVPALPPSPAPTEPALDVRSDRARYGRYVALVIGSADYTYLPDVATADGDSAAVAQLLERRYGFETTHLRNPNRTALSGALQRYERDLGPNDNFLLYWAGHGSISAELGRCTWLPVDALGDDPSEGLNSDDVAGALDRMKAKHAIVVADSCFTNADRREAGLPDTAADATLRLSKRRTRVVLMSGGLEPIQDGRGSGHSVFTGAFLSALSDNRDVLDGTALFARIRAQGVEGASQTPEYANIREARHQGGDFLFVPGP